MSNPELKSRAESLQFKVIQGGVAYATSKEFLRDFRGMLWKSLPELGLTWDEISLRSGKGISTVENFLFAKTKDPRIGTVMAIAKAAGFRFGVLDVNAPLAKGEHDLRPYSRNQRKKKKLNGRKKAQLADYYIDN